MTSEIPIVHTSMPPHTADSLKHAQAACRRIPPLWPLTHFVAVNPFLGLSEHPFIDACETMGWVTDGGMLMPAEYFQEQWENGSILPGNLTAALSHAQTTLPESWKNVMTSLSAESLQEWLQAASSQKTVHEGTKISTVADAIDQTNGTSWNAIIVDEISRFCAAYTDVGQSAWRMPWQDQPLFSAWRAEASIDAGPESLGLRGFRNFVAQLPEDASAAIEFLLNCLGVNNEKAEDFFHRQLMSIRGWAGAIQYRVRENGMSGREDDSLLHLLAIRLAYEASLADQATAVGVPKVWQDISPATAGIRRDLLSHTLWQEAFEHAWQIGLFKTLAAPQLPPAASESSRKAAQAVFCIDVRSEVFRRSLESASPDIETLGFAGFFGLPIEYLPFGQHDGSTQCPVLLTPGFRIGETSRHTNLAQEEAALQSLRIRKRIGYAWNSFKTSAVSCFSFVEAAGLAFGPKLVSDAFVHPAPAKPRNMGPDLDPTLEAGTGIDLATRIQLAAGILGKMGLTDHFARLVLLCGHGSGTVNNPYGSGLDCGACGGNTGEANARVGAAIFNDPRVRTTLAEQGIHIPADTWFLAGLHNTTTDDVTLFDLEEVPASHQSDLADLHGALVTAGKTTRHERAPLLGLKGEKSSEKLDLQVRARSRDWAQVRPEWGLAGNAAFIVAPRERTRGRDLGGRAFLHNYDAQADTDNSTLELIMTAPMIVTNWINLQYYASTVNNPVFGSGNKVIHNIVGTTGVCLGNGGDLQTGLPLQSVHDGERWIHEPHRLNVIIEAPRDRIAAVIAKHKSVRDLVDHGWLHLFAWEDDARTVYRYRPGSDWGKLDV